MVATADLRVVIVDDQDLVLHGLSAVLDGADGIAVVGTATTADGAMETVDAMDPDAVLLDLELGSESGLEVVRHLRDRAVRARILVLSAHDAPADLRDALQAGVDGYLLKTAGVAELVDGIRRAAQGETVIAAAFVPKLVEEIREPSVEVDLTPRERQVLELLAQGLANREIATRLEMGTRTAQKHVENLFKKFGVHDRGTLAAEAHRLGFLRSTGRVQM